MTATPLVEGIWLVGSGEVARSRSDPHDCHVYLVYDGTSAALVDCGTGLGAPAILANVAEVCDLSAVGAVVCTHYHADHAGGIASLKRELEAPVMASEATRDALQQADEEATQVRAAREAGVYPPGFRLEAAAVDRVLGDGDEVAVGGLSLRAIETPGHCDGHLGFAVETPAGLGLFSGDCVFRGGHVSIQAIPDCRVDRYAATLQRLNGLAPEALFPGHADIVCAGAAAGIAAAAASFARLVPAPNLLR